MLGSVLYLAAHPDDENTLMLAYLAQDRLARTAYLSLTRGDGGQNLIGSEQGYKIGLIRTQELLAARRIDGAQQFFSRAYDFGFSKTRDETLDFWGKEKVLGDVVWLIRKYQPDVMITRFPPDERAGHGHHQASAYLAEEAFRLAADPSAYPEQLKEVKTWKTKRVVWNGYSRGFANQPPDEEGKPYISVQIGGYNPLLGQSYTEIAARSRSQHKSQGFGASPIRDLRTDYLIHKDGEPAQKDLFDGVDVSWNRVKGSQEVARLVKQAIQGFSVENPAASVPTLVKIHQALAKLDQGNTYVQAKKEEVQQLIQQCLGLWFESNPADFAVVPGERIMLSTNVVNRAKYPVKLVSMKWTGRTSDSTLNLTLEPFKGYNYLTTVPVPAQLDNSQPYWLKKPLDKGIFQIDNQRDVGYPENRPPTFTEFTFEVDGQRFTYSKPWIYKFSDPVEGEMYQPFELRPPVTTTLNEPVYIFTGPEPQSVEVLVQAHKSNVKGTLRLEVPPSWKVTPASIEFNVDEKYLEPSFTFTVQPPAQAGEGTLRAVVDVNGQAYTQSLRSIKYPHIPVQSVFPASEAKVARLDVKNKAQRVGYIAGAGDEVPAALRQMGSQVTFLNEAQLSGDLSHYDAIVVGVRAYNTEDRLAVYQQKLLSYVEKGGTLVVQYATASGLKVPQIGPYPLSIGRDRVTEEDADMQFLKPEHPLLNYPNKITRQDFEGWVQERGLYFATKWDPRYQTILASHDQGEPPLEGSLLYASYGKGHYMYTGLSFFRELPAGVTGAYRLFANLISVGK
ncbi:hypothetical protein GCM10027275_13710 [Rhabdobacter roseus]